MESSKEEHEHAEKFIKYQHLRGGKVVFQPIERPAQDSWETPLAAMEYVLNMEKQVNQVTNKFISLNWPILMCSLIPFPAGFDGFT